MTHPFTFEQTFIINDILVPRMFKAELIMSLFDIYEITEDETMKSIIESLLEKLDIMSENEIRDISRNLPLETYVD